MTSRPLPDRLRCGAFLAYPPRPTSDVGQTAHDLVLAIKRDAIDPRRGRAYADVRRLWTAFGPDLEIAAFALAHVCEDRGLHRVADPRVFEITLRGGDVSRRRT